MRRISEALVAAIVRSCVFDGHMPPVATSPVTTDSPSICFAEDLINAYPDAKVVLVVRDIDTWYRSFEELINEYYLPIHRILQYLDPQLIGGD